MLYLCCSEWNQQESPLYFITESRPARGSWLCRPLQMQPHSSRQTTGNSSLVRSVTDATPIDGHSMACYQLWQAMCSVADSDSSLDNNTSSYNDYYPSCRSMTSLYKFPDCLLSVVNSLFLPISATDILAAIRQIPINPIKDFGTQPNTVAKGHCVIPVQLFLSN